MSPSSYVVDIVEEEEEDTIHSPSSFYYHMDSNLDLVVIVVRQ